MNEKIEYKTEEEIGLDLLEIWEGHPQADLLEKVKNHKGPGPLHLPLNPRKFKIGNTYRGMRKGSASDGKLGVLVRAYYTVNFPFKNQAYVLRCEDGKERVYQFIQEPDAPVFGRD